MIRSVAHPTSRAIQRAHVRRNRHMWTIMAVLFVLAALLLSIGYFNDVDLSTLGYALLRTTYRLAISYGLALVFGTGIALLAGWGRYSDYLFPFFDILQNIPSFALIPIFIYFFGYTDEMIILFSVSSVIWPILFSVLTAIKNAHADLNDAATIFGAVREKRIAYYLMPLSYPAILTGSVVGIAIGWEAVIGAEIIASTQGFGAFIKDASATGISPAMIAGTLGILAIVFVINRLIWAPLLAESGQRYAE